MTLQNDSNRQRKWYERNVCSNPRCVKHIEDVMYKQDFSDYKFKDYDGVLSVYMYFENSTYILTMAEDKYSINVLQKNKKNGKVRRIGNYKQDYCWLDSIESIIRYEVE